MRRAAMIAFGEGLDRLWPLASEVHVSAGPTVPLGARIRLRWGHPERIGWLGTVIAVFAHDNFPYFVSYDNGPSERCCADELEVLDAHDGCDGVPSPPPLGAPSESSSPTPPRRAVS